MAYGSLLKGSMVIAKNIIFFHYTTVNDEVNVELWHKRLSHMSEKGLKILTKKKIIFLI